MINIHTINSKICNINQVWQALINAFLDNPDNIDITMNGEGPCLRSIGLYDILDGLCDRFSYARNHVRILTSNMLESHDDYQIIPEHQSYELKAIKQLKNICYQKNLNSEFKHFGNFIGHANKYRLQTASFLWNHFRDKTLQTFHCKMTEDYHREFLGIEDLMYSGSPPTELQDALNLIIHAPLMIDQINDYPILIPANLNITKAYPSFFVEIVNLTFFSGDVFYIDEKVWRPIIMRTPFIIQGPRNTLKNLKKLGFKTFDRWWDEGYSEDVEDCQMVGIKENISTLSTMELSEISKMYADMQPVLEHNYQRLMELTPKDFEIFVRCVQ